MVEKVVNELDDATKVRNLPLNPQMDAEFPYSSIISLRSKGKMRQWKKKKNNILNLVVHQAQPRLDQAGCWALKKR